MVWAASPAVPSPSMLTAFIIFLLSSQAVNVTNTDGSVVETPPTPSHGVSAQMDSTSQVRKCVSLSDIFVWNHSENLRNHFLYFCENVQLFVLSHVMWHSLPGEWHHAQLHPSGTKIKDLNMRNEIVEILLCFSWSVSIKFCRLYLWLNQQPVFSSWSSSILVWAATFWKFSHQQRLTRKTLSMISVKTKQNNRLYRGK